MQAADDAFQAAVEQFAQSAEGRNSWLCDLVAIGDYERVPLSQRKGARPPPSRSGPRNVPADQLPESSSKRRGPLRPVEEVQVVFD